VTAIAILSLLLTTTSAIEASKTNIGTIGGEEMFLTSPYIIPIFLSMVFAAAVLSSRTRIPHTMILVGFGRISNSSESIQDCLSIS
jgi:hypothetical protein